jgi:hypothetical protein
MPWVSQYSSSIFHWNYNTSVTPNRLVRGTQSSEIKSTLEFKGSTNYNFKSNKTYIWKTYVSHFNSASQSGSGYPIRNLSITPPYKSGSTFSYQGKLDSSGALAPNAYTLPEDAETNNCLIFIDRPTTNLSKIQQIIYSATFSGFDSSNLTNPSGIAETKLIEIDWLIQGYSFATSSTPLRDIYYEGWRYDESDESFTFNHQNKSGTYRLPLSLASSVSGDLNLTAQATKRGTPYVGITASNFICRYIDTPIFNMNLTYTVASGYIDVYLFETEPPITTNVTTFNSFLNTGQKIASLTASSTSSFYNLNGEKYLTFVCEYKNNSSPYQNTLSNIQIIEGYSDTDNNEEFLLTNTDQYFDPIALSPVGASDYATYSAVITTPTTRHEVGAVFFGATGATGSFSGFFSNIYGSIVNLSSQKSKIGNSQFKSGVWENGVWNNGLRIDESVFEFDDVSIAIKMSTKNINWRIQIQGSTGSVANFEIGDKIAVSNIVAIDINEERKLLSNYYTIVNKTDSLIVVETENNFPIRRIEKDSEIHKILVTKNIWLNGGFLNGYFEGVWNNGLFRGYPYITEMYNSHWVDGTFNGGHFFSAKNWFIFTDTYYYEGYVGLTFGATAHGFITGDKVIIDKFDKTINADYDGIHTVTEVIDNYLVITDKLWETSTTTEEGIVYKQAPTGLVQNFKFFDNNVSSKTTQTSNDLKQIWRFNSWMDLVYKTQSSTNIGSNKILFNASSNNINEVLETHKFGFGDYTAMNLYGYVTDDVLSSESQLRDSDTFFKRNYSLGTKYEIYQDFLGDISEFNNSFDSNPELGNLENFYNDGWTYSFSGILATYSFLNRYIKQRSAVQDFTSYDYTSGSNYLGPTFSFNGGGPIWGTVSFNSLVEDSFGLLLSEDVANQSFGVSISGVYQVNINIPANFYTAAYAPGLGSVLDNDRLYLAENSIVGELRLIKFDETKQGFNTLSKKIIKTTGGDFNVGIDFFEEGEDYAEYESNLNLTIDWKGELKSGDRLRVLFQRCRTIIQNYNLAGPWRGSGFEQGFGFNDNITDVAARWRFGTASTISINNEGTEQSIGFNIKRTVDKTLQYESDKEISFFTLNNTNINIEKNRYSMIEFDIIQQPDSLLNIFSYGTQSFNLQFHTIDLYNFTNILKPNQTYGPVHAFPAGYDPLIDPFNDYLSIYSNGIDYKYSGQTTIKEFFYNRPGLDLGFWNFNTQYTENDTTKIHEVDNVKFYEVDMIPFFQYTTEEYINKQIQVPLIGVAPIIDYSDENFNFVGNIQISLDGISVNSNLISNTIFVNTTATTTPGTLGGGSVATS